MEGILLLGASVFILAVCASVFLGWKEPLAVLGRLGWKILFPLLALYVLLVILSGVFTWIADHPLSYVLGLAVIIGAGTLFYLGRAGTPWNFAAGFSQTSSAASSAELVPSFRPFVGKKQSGHLVTVDAEDTVGVVGPPRSGKTAGILIPQALMWAGPMISVSVRGDILKAVGDQRAAIARPHGGGIYIFDPAEGAKQELAALVEGDLGRVPFIRWSPIAGCEKPELAKLRAEAMVWASFTEGQRNPHFERRASMILRTMFHAAALHDLQIKDVLLWIQENNVIKPADLIKRSESTEKEGWISELLGLDNLAAEERGSCFSTAANALDAFTLSTVQRNCSTTDIDLRQLVKEHSTLFVTSGVAMQKALAPLFSALIESAAFAIIDELSREHGGRLEPRLLLQLDEVANIAPLPNFVQLLTLCGGSGICLAYACQGWKQLAARYGQDEAKAIWQSTKAQLVFGGVGDFEVLQEMSGLMGRRKERVVSQTRGRFKGPFEGSTTRTEQDTPRLHADEIFQADKAAHLFYRGDFQRVTPALYFDVRTGQPFNERQGWTP